MFSLADSTSEVKWKDDQTVIMQNKKLQSSIHMKFKWWLENYNQDKQEFTSKTQFRVTAKI
jgi:hypothetical protein